MVNIFLKSIFLIEKDSTDHPKPPQGKVEFLELSRKCNKIRWKTLQYNGGKQVTSFVIERSVAGKKSWTLLVK